MKTKRLLRFLIIAMLCLIFVIPITKASVNKNQAISIVTTQIYLNHLDSINIYLYPDSIKTMYYKMCPYDSLLNPYSTSWLFFIDTEPWYNWDHNCRYIFVNYSNGDYQILNEHTPPFDFKNDFDSISIGYEVEHVILQQNVPSSPRTSLPDPHKYAIIFSCSGDDKLWNNMSHMYCALQESYGFTSDNMIVLSYDGYAHPDEGYNRSLNLDNDPLDIPDIDGPCTKNQLIESFEWMADNLQDDDLLFVFATTHGFFDSAQTNVSYLKLYDDIIWDYELAPYVDAIHCSEIIIIIDACSSGGFVDDLEGNHRVVYTPVPYNTPTGFTSGFDFDEFSYAWGTTIRGVHPLDDNEPWKPSDPIGTKLDIHSIFPEVTVDINPDVTNGGNNDGLFQTNEALNYGCYLSSNILIHHQEATHTGFDEGLLSLYGISGTVTQDQTVSGPFLIGNRLILDYGVDLVVTENSKFYLNPNATIESRASSSIEFGDNLEFWGFDNNNYMDIHGTCSFGDYIKFDAGEGIRWVGLNLYNNTKEYQISNSTFTNCDLSDYCDNLAVSSSEFTYSGINHTSGGLAVNDCSFTHANLQASNSGVNNLVNIEDCSFMNTGSPSGSCIELNYCNSFAITNCTIQHDYHSHGIGIFNSGIVEPQKRQVTGCEIYNPPSRTGMSTDGIRLYNSYADIEMNNIHNNGVGIDLFNNAISYITGKPEFTSEAETQRIKNNVYCQVSAWENCFPTEFKWNSIYQDYPSGIYMAYASSCQQNDFNIEKNYWGGLKDLTYHLNPLTCFDYDPIWQMGGKLKDDNIVKILYDSTIVLVSSADYIHAESIFKEIILTYPDNKYATASIKDLFYLKAIYNNDYQGLKYYYDSTAIATEQPNLAKLSRFFSNQCDVKLGNYQNAIDWNNNVLLHPDSFEDSIFALIDRDYVYLLMQNDSSKSDPPGIPSFVPRTFNEFIVKRDSLLDLLMTNNINSLGIDTPKNNENQDSKESLYQNYPNPFKDQTTFTFTLPKDSEVSMCIYDQLGRQVLSFPMKFYEKGTHSIDFRNDRLTPGVYYYKILINNKPEEAKKLMII